MCTALSQLLSLPIEWLRVPLGTLQCAAASHSIASFTVETPLPKKLDLIYTKFDFSESEAPSPNPNPNPSSPSNPGPLFNNRPWSPNPN